jgi:hypothetical protein
MRNLVNPVAVAGMLGLSLFSLLSASPAAAQVVVYDNGGPNFPQAYGSDPGVDDYQADTFSFGMLTSFDTVQWYGLYAPGNTPTATTDNFEISIYGTTAGVPHDTAIPGLTFNVGSNVNRTPTGSTISGFPVYSYSSALPSGVSLPTGTYAISILNTTSADPDDNWWWVTSAQTGNFYTRAFGPDWWVSAPNELSFRLINSNPTVSAAPEPGSLALLVLSGLPVVGVIVRRNRLAPRRLT